jgi:hypothetical protein
VFSQCAHCRKKIFGNLATLLPPSEAKVKGVWRFFRKRSAVSHNLWITGTFPVISTEALPKPTRHAAL